MKVLKWILALVIIGCIGWGANWYLSRPPLPSVEQVSGAIVDKYFGNKTLGGGDPLVKVSVNRVRGIQRVGYLEYTAIADVTLVFRRDPSIAFGAANIHSGQNEKMHVGESAFKISRKKGQKIAKYLPVGTTRKLRKQTFEIEYNKHIGSGPIRGYYYLSSRP